VTATREIKTGGTVDRDNWRAVGGEPLGERQHVTFRRTGGTRAEQGVDRHRGLGPGFVAAQLAHPVQPRERAIVDCIVRLGIESSNAHRNPRRMQCARDHPAVAPIVSRAACDQHATCDRRGGLGDEHLCDRAARRFHQDTTRHAILRARRRIPRCRFGRREHRNQIHEITTPA
jgi:hypothetical protein